MECVEKTHEISRALVNAATTTRPWSCGASGFESAFGTLRTLVRALPHPPAPGQKRLRLAVLHAGGPAPGMNTAARAAVRLAVRPGSHHAGRAQRFPRADRRR